MKASEIAARVVKKGGNTVLTKNTSFKLSEAYLKALEALHKLGEKHTNMAYVSEILKELGEE